MRILWAAPLALLFAASCSTVSVHTDHDPAVDLSKYHTYDWVSPQNQPDCPTCGLQKKATPNANQQLLSDPVLVVKIERIIGNALEKAGFKKSQNGNPDFLVGFYTITRDKVWISNWDAGWGWGWGPWRSYWGWGPSYAEVRPEGSLVVVFFDAHTRQPIWTGRASGVIGENPEESDKDIADAVKEMMKDFTESLNKKK